MDWSQIKKLSETEARTVVKDYFTQRSFTCEEIDPMKLPKGKLSPDFSISDGRFVFFCEVKTPEHKLNLTTNMYNWDTTFYKLKSLIHKAVKQFKDFSPEHDISRVLAFTSNHPQLNYTHLIHNIIGSVVLGGSVIRNLSELSNLNNWQKDLPEVDIVLWFQVNYLTKEAFQLNHFINLDSHLIDESKQLVNLFTPYSRND